MRPAAGSAGSSWRSSTAAAATPGLSASTDRISSSSIRKPAQLDLAVEPAQVLQLAVGPQPAPVAGAVHPLAGDRVGDEPLRGQLRAAAGTASATPAPPT